MLNGIGRLRRYLVLSLLLWFMSQLGLFAGTVYVLEGKLRPVASGLEYFS